jgi:two-component system, NarL family, sensor histidine kinase DesK
VNPAGQQWWIVRWAPRLMLALHVPVLAQAPILVATDGVLEHSALETAAAVLMGIAAAILHLRHIRAASRDVRPALWALTVTVQIAMAFAGLAWFGPDWSSALLPAMTSAMLLLPRAWRWPLGFGMFFALGFTVYGVNYALVVDARTVVLELVYFAIMMPLFVFALYITVRLVPLVEELYRTRSELAGAAVDRERVRLSRDLHDLLGQSLSAIALKADLAVRLLAVNPVEAKRETQGLTDVARTALRELHAVTFDEHRTALTGEIDTAVALLAAAGIAVDLDLPGLEPPPAAEVEAVLAWAVREGSTNLLRHSSAQTCSISVRRDSRTVVLDMVNDGVPASPAEVTGGSGLAGLAERAESLGGSVTAQADGPVFRLRVAVPDANGRG